MLKFFDNFHRQGHLFFTLFDDLNCELNVNIIIFVWFVQNHWRYLEAKQFETSNVHSPHVANGSDNVVLKQTFTT